MRILSRQTTSGGHDAGRFPWFVVLFLLATAPLAAGAAAAGPTLQTYPLVPGVLARVLADGTLVVGTGPDQPALVTVAVQPLPVARRSHGRTEPPFTAILAEGAAGGQRGFSARRDDDGDGAVDEDPLDGLDNDGDGRTDEDFAAISDGMVVVHRDGLRGSGGSSHVEYYNWKSPQLRGTVFLSVSSPGGEGRFDLTGASWRESGVTSGRHGLAGQPENTRVNAFVARLPRPGADSAGEACDPGSRLWLGVTILGDGARSRVLLDAGELRLPLGEGTTAVALCVAESWQQLAARLNEAVKVQAGVTDKVTGRRAPWIVPPLCAKCRLAEIPRYHWRRDDAGNLRLETRVAPGLGGAGDPDLFRLGETWLGSPLEIRFTPDQGPATAFAWGCHDADQVSSFDRLDAPFGRLVGLLDHQVTGRLEYIFKGTAWGSAVPGDRIDGMSLDGRPFRAALAALPAAAALQDEPAAPVAVEPAAPAPATDQGQVLRSGGRGLTLSPHLLEGFPNPFQDVIRLRFEVPATMGEAFVWDPNEDPPAGFDVMAAIPWKSGDPNVTVKIYSINGQELVTLFSGNLGPGESTVQWSGTDSAGRQVSSGTYFCKLQMDDWSVTRRLVFLR